MVDAQDVPGVHVQARPGVIVRLKPVAEHVLRRVLRPSALRFVVRAPLPEVRPLGLGQREGEDGELLVRADCPVVVA